MIAASLSKHRTWPAEEAKAVAREVVEVLKPHCDVRGGLAESDPGRPYIICAGSLRRRKLQVHDVEFLFIPKFRSEPDPENMFARRPVSLVDEALNGLLTAGLIAKRLNKIEVETWGPNNKLAIHVPSGMPIDFFAATRETWFCNLVCRTGGEANNIKIAAAARAKGWKWNSTGSGFTALDRIAEHKVTSEQDIFEFVGLKYLEPWRRE